MRGCLAVVALLWSLLGMAGLPHADSGALQILVSGALGVPLVASDDGQITLRIASGLPVSLVQSGHVVPGPVGVATFAEWSDATPTAGFGPAADLMVFRLVGNVMVVAGGIAVPGGFVTTFSATSPFQTLSGTWSITGGGAGSGVTGADPADAIITFRYDSNPNNTVSGVARFVAAGALASQVSKNIPGRATVDVLRNVPVRDVVNGAVAGPVATLTSYAARDVVGQPLEYVRLDAINFGGVYVVYGCAVPQLLGGLACPVGASGSAAHLSGHVEETAAESVKDISGLNGSDLLLRLSGSLP